MNRASCRPPAFRWSLILLSTLLLSPAATSALLHALSRPVATLPAREGALPNQTPRRLNDDDEAIRAAARSGQLKVVRLEPAPEQGERDATLAVLVPAPLPFLVPVARTKAVRTPAAPAERRRTTVCGTRAPPRPLS
jgi:hypothetical protein